MTCAAAGPELSLMPDIDAGLASLACPLSVLQFPAADSLDSPTSLAEADTPFYPPDLRSLMFDPTGFIDSEAAFQELVGSPVTPTPTSRIRVHMKFKQEG